VAAGEPGVPVTSWAIVDRMPNNEHINTTSAVTAVLMDRSSQNKRQTRRLSGLETIAAHRADASIG
jgi:hypothetical protein